MTNKLPRYVDSNELAHMTGLAAAWLRREALARRLPVVVMGRRLMFDPVAVREVLDQRAAISKKGGAL